MKRSALVVLICGLFFSVSSYAQIVINEGSNRNYNTIPDEDGDYPDWIEIYNAGASTVSLHNHYLTDNPNNPQKWAFPAIDLAPNDYRIIFCSGKDRKPISDFVNVLTATSYHPTNGWNTHTFSTPFYWDGVSNVLINTCSYSSAGYTVNSIFNQSATSFPSTTFAFQDGSDAACWSQLGNPVNQRPNLRLNGMTIGTGTIQNSGTDYPAPYGNWYWAAKHQILIRASELTAAGLSAGMINSLSFDVASTDPGMIYDYVEIDMKLVAFDDMSSYFETVNPNLYQHTNFSIAQGGEYISLYSPGMIELSALTVDCQNLNESKGSFPDASTNIVYFETPTPDATNNNTSGFVDHLLAPVFSEQSGIYGTTVNVEITNPNGAGSTIYYTTDGSEPTTASNVYSGTAIPIFYSNVLRARAFENGFLPSPITAASYLLGIDHETPVISIITDNSNLYGPTGIFDNWQYDWQRAAHIDYFTEDSMALLFSQNTGMQVDGGWGGSRSHPQHSFRLELANGTLGEDPVHYPIIPNRPNRDKYSNFYLRNGSNQFLQFPYKEAYQEQALSGTTKNYYSAWRPVTVYINGGYFGLYELREKMDDEYFNIYDDADKDSIDILSLSAWNNSVLRSVVGNPVDTFYTIYNQFNGLNPNSTTYWEDADQYFDQTYYTDYIIAESWVGNTDWPQNNIKIYRSNATDFRYRFCTIDMELALNPYAWSDCYSDHISYMLGQSTDNPFINIWLQGMQNNRFHDYFINRFADVMNTEYLPERTIPLENSFFNQTVVEMQNEYQRWGDPNNIPGQMTDFYNSHLTMQSEMTERTNQVRNHIENNFNLPNQVDLTLDVHPNGAGKIHISTIEPTEYPWNGVYFNGVPIKIEAIPSPGYTFANWGTNGLISNILDPVFLDTLDITTIQFDAYFEGGVGLDENTATNGFSLYPNPAKHQIALVDLKGNTNEALSYQLVDLTGRVLKSNELNTAQPETIIDLSGLPNAMYLIRVVSNTEVKEQLRFVKAE